MFYAQLEPWAEVTLYLVSVGLSLELAYRAYAALSRRASAAPIGVTRKSLLMAFAASLPLVTTIAITAGFCAYVDRESLQSLGLRLDGKSGASLFSGAAIAFTTISIIFVVGYAVGWFRVKPSKLSSDFSKGLPIFCGGVSDFITASIFEELIMRGYVFTVLLTKVGPLPAIIGSSCGFAVAHLIKHKRLPILFTLNCFLFGVLTAQMRLSTGALWMPIGLHLGWNFAAASIFGMPFGGRLYHNGLVVCHVDGPRCITGGNYSTDAGLLGTIGIAFAAAAAMMVGPGA